jgi:hypothetical protein
MNVRTAGPRRMSGRTAVEPDLYQPRPPDTCKVSVRFRDGEKLVGSTRHLDRYRAELFFTPLDPRGNNLRVFAVFDAFWGCSACSDRPGGEPSAEDGRLKPRRDSIEHLLELRQARDVPADNRTARERGSWPRCASSPRAGGAAPARVR